MASSRGFRRPQAMHRAAALCTVLVASFVSTATRADWQYTKWGMTPDEVVAASHGLVSKVPAGQGEISKTSKQAEGSYVLPTGEKLGVSFDFMAGKLAAVNVTLIGENQTEMVRALRRTYGKPISVERSDISTRTGWRSKEHNLYVELFEFTTAGLGPFRSVSYRPVIEPGQAGF